MASPSTARAFYGRSEDTMLLELRGPIRYAIAKSLRAAVDDMALADADQVVIDLRSVSFIDSTGLGLIARLGRRTLERRGRRAVIICPDNDVATALLSAALDVLFAFVHEPPFVEAPALKEIPLDGRLSAANADATLGRIVLEAHHDLGALSERNREEYREVIAALEAELSTRRVTPS